MTDAPAPTFTMLYKRSEKPHSELGRRKLTYKIVTDDRIEDAEADGWSRSPDEAENPAAKSLLDGSAKEIEQSLPTLSDDDLLAALDAEKAGKTRKSVLAAIEAEAGRRTEPKA